MKPIDRLMGNRPFIEAHVRGHLPTGWQLVHCGVDPIPGTDGVSAVIQVGAEGPRGEQTGVRWEVSTALFNDSVEDSCASIGDELRRKCEARAIETQPGTIRFVLEEGARQPKRGSDGASGYDLYAPLFVYLQPNRTTVIHTGVRLEMPRGFEGQVRPRSSMSKRGLIVHFGTIDQDYRGVIGATITNTGTDAQKIEQGDRIAQLVIARVEHPEWVQVQATELGETARGDKGFGSTGA